MQRNPDHTDEMYNRSSAEILMQRVAVADAILAQESGQCSELEHRAALQAADSHLTYLAGAVAMESPSLFTDYLAWSKVRTARKDVPASDFAHDLECMARVLNAVLSEQLRERAVRIVEHGLRELPDLPFELPDCAEEDAPHAILAHQYIQVLLRGERHLASKLILDAVTRGISIKEIYIHVFQRSQYEIGRLWQTNEISVAEEHYCSAATQLIMSQLYPYIFMGERNGGTFVCTSVSGDLHEIGGRMIADFMEMAGWNSYYLGASTPSDCVIQTLLERNAHALGISATMTYHVPVVTELIRKIRSHPVCSGVKILVGGYPFNLEPDLWRKVGADGSSCDADSVIALAGQLTGRMAIT